MPHGLVAGRGAGDCRMRASAWRRASRSRSAFRRLSLPIDESAHRACKGLRAAGHATRALAASTHDKGARDPVAGGRALDAARQDRRSQMPSRQSTLIFWVQHDWMSACGAHETQRRLIVVQVQVQVLTILLTMNFSLVNCPKRKFNCHLNS